MPKFEVRPVRPEDAREMAELLAAVAEERDGIATEPPVDVDARTDEFAASAASSLVAEADGAIIGMIHVGEGRFGVGELAMLVERGWRGRGVGSALVAAAIEGARIKGLHKLSLDVFAHNAAAIALYHKLGFVEEGRRVAQYRRSSGGPMGLDRDGAPALISPSRSEPTCRSYTPDSLRALCDPM